MANNEKVTQVIDGDTFKTTRRTKSIRLANVDAPEKANQAILRQQTPFAL